jgi:phosphate transport system substrate-binding protein|tara:strand:+ start:31397 stop:32239 length:843 start_codon:yes stop_codon:yes gene_type:complete
MSSGCLFPLLRGKFMKRRAFLMAFLSCTVLSPAHAVDERYRDYEPRPGLSGEVAVAGAPAPSSLMLLWPESFRMLQPQTVLHVGAKTGGAKVRAAVEALAILVNDENPLTCISLDDLKNLYTDENLSWDGVGAGGAAAPVTPFTRETRAGESDFFVDAVMNGVPFSADVRRVARYSDLLDRLAETPGGIGYAPAGYRGDGVKALQVSDGGGCAAPSASSAYRADYPLARFVHLEGMKNEVSLAFFDYVLSQDGQRDGVIAGFYSLPWVFAEEEREKLRLD